MELSWLLIAALLATSLLTLCHCNDEVTVEGTVRLADGDTVNQGRVEIYINGSWGTVCDSQWDLLDGKVVCVQLNYTNVTEVKLGAYYGEGEGPIHFYGMDCTGNEMELIQCKTHRRKNCQHDDDAGVVCYPPPADPGGLSTTALGVIILVPFLLLIGLIVAAIVVMMYKFFSYDRATYEREEVESRRKRFTHGLSLNEQSMLATKGRRGFFRASRRRSDIPISGSSSFVDRHNIPRAALGEGHAHPWQTNYEEETDIDDDEVFMNSHSGTSSSRSRARRSVEAFNTVVLSDDETIDDVTTNGTTDYGEDDSDVNPYDDEPQIDQ